MNVYHYGGVFVVETGTMNVAYHDEAPLAVVFKHEDGSRTAYQSTYSPTNSMTPVRKAVEALGCQDAEKISYNRLVEMVRNDAYDYEV